MLQRTLIRRQKTSTRWLTLFRASVYTSRISNPRSISSGAASIQDTDHQPGVILDHRDLDSKIIGINTHTLDTDTELAPHLNRKINCISGTSNSNGGNTCNILNNSKHNVETQRRNISWISNNIEAEIWYHIQRGSLHKAIEIGISAYKTWSLHNTALSSLTQFALAKRALSTNDILASIKVVKEVLQLTGSTGSELDTNALDYSVFFGAMLADHDSKIIEMYNSLDSQHSMVIDALFSTSVYYFHSRNKRHWQAKVIYKSLPTIVQRVINTHPLGYNNVDTVEKGVFVEFTIAALMLRRPTPDFTSVDISSKLIGMLLNIGITPDASALETLVSSSIRCQSPRSMLCVYSAKNSNTSSLQDSVNNLSLYRVKMMKNQPRIHHDAMCTFIRNKDLESAISVASAVGERQLFHLLIAYWVFKNNADYINIPSIVKAMVDAVKGNILFSTHSASIIPLIDAADQSHTEKDTLRFLDAALDVHWTLAPVLESPSQQTIHRLMESLTRHGRVIDAFKVYRDSESRTNWTSSKRFVVNETTYSILADGLAQLEDIRGISYLTQIVANSGITVTSKYYIAMIKGLTRLSGDISKYKKENHIGKRAVLDPFYLKKIQIAESLLEIMKERNIERSVAAYHSIMYAWALVCRPEKTRLYFDLMTKEEKENPTGDVKVNEVSWGILMYAYVRTENVKEVLHILNMTKDNLATKISDGTQSSPQFQLGNKERTSYFINMTMDALLRNGDATRALMLLESHIGNDVDDYRQEPNDKKKKQLPDQYCKLPVTPGDPITLNMIVRSLLLSQRVLQAIDVHKSIHKQFNLPDTQLELYLLLRHSTRSGNIAAAFGMVDQILKIGSVPTDRQWFELLQLCASNYSPHIVVDLYHKICSLRNSNGDPYALPLLLKYPDAANWVCDVLRVTGNKEEASIIQSKLAQYDNRVADNVSTKGK